MDLLAHPLGFEAQGFVSQMLYPSPDLESCKATDRALALLSDALELLDIAGQSLAAIRVCEAIDLLAIPASCDLDTKKR